MKFITSFLTEKQVSARKDLSLLLLFFGVSFFQFLGKIPLLEPDEGRYAEIPREMLERGDFITPLLNYVKYFEKPPLHYWLNALSFTIFGENEFAARFAGTLCGLLGVLLTYHIGRKLFDRRVGLLSALILGTSVGYLAQSRINFTDMTLTFCLSAALGCFILATRDEEPGKGLYYHLFYIFAALALLAKGLIGIVLPGAIIFLYLLLTKRWMLLKEMRLLTGIPLFLLICAPWFILVSMRNPEFARFFFIHEHFERFLTRVHGRYQPFWYFLPVLAGCMLPWSIFIPAAVKRVWKERRTEGWDHRLFLLLWAAIIFLFFSKSNSKLIPYILPVFPALSILIGDTFSAVFDGKFKPLKIQAYVVAGFLAILGAGLILYPYVAPKPAISTAGGAVMGMIFLCGGVFALRSTFKASAVALFASLALFSFTFGIIGPPFILSGIAERKSLKELGSLAGEKAGSDTMLVSFGFNQGLSFYAKRRVIIVENRGELEFGSKQGDQSAWFIDRPQFGRQWDSSAPVVALLKEAELNELKGFVKAPIKVLGKQGKKILITNR
ncbi:MAG: glycosyl transferase family [Geobacteraceae bacterium]|nr:MAG: glycosyl transferase family [Geobacteraceae bacterium]